VVLIDPDILDAGNLVRHTLSGSEIGSNKASSLAAKLMSVSPFASIRHVNDWLPTNKEKLESLLEDRDAVIDCTGSDEALMALERGWWGTHKFFVSASVSYEARKLLIFATYGHSFCHTDFRKAIDPYIEAENCHRTDRAEIFEGPGCWSPVFPARMDDLMLAGAACVKFIEKFVAERRVRSAFAIFEQTLGEQFDGFRRIQASRPEAKE